MFDYLNDTEGLYVGFCTRVGGNTTEYHCARYSDWDVAKDNASHVISSMMLQYVMLLPEDTLLLSMKYLAGLDEMESPDLLEGKAFVLEAKPIGIFIVTKGFPKGEPNTIVQIVQDHSLCTDGHCLELEPNFSHSY